MGELSALDCYRVSFGKLCTFGSHLSRAECLGVCRTGLFATFALWWYIELLPDQQFCENSSAFFRAVPRDFRTGRPDLDDSIATCEGYMAYGTDLFGQVYNDTVCAANYTLIQHKSASLALHCHTPKCACCVRLNSESKSYLDWIIGSAVSQLSHVP